MFIITVMLSMLTDLIKEFRIISQNLLDTNNTSFSWVTLKRILAVTGLSYSHQSRRWRKTRKATMIFRF